MFKRISLACAGAVLVLGSFACATPTDNPSNAESSFVTSVQTDLLRRFPTTTDAEQAGYFRYSNQDATGSIGYANPQYWNSIDARHPSQLWYDVNGELLGADFTVPIARHRSAPHLWGVNPARWAEFKHARIHYILKNADGTIYDATEREFDAAGADIADHVTASALARLRNSTVFFEYPAVWDLHVWVKSNPHGAFATANPNAP